MNKIFSLMLFIMSSNVLAQEIDIVREEKSENSNGKYTSYSLALQNINDVEVLDIVKEDANEFLKSETYFPNLSYLSIHFTKNVYRPRDFKNFNNLKTIAIRYCWDLSSLPEDFTMNQSLERVLIYNCGLAKLNESFFSNPNIKSVGICGNYLFSLPEIPVNNNIQYLNIAYNPIYELPESSKYLTHLEILSLKGLLFYNIPGEVFEMKNLKSLELSLTKSEYPQSFIIQ